MIVLPNSHEEGAALWDEEHVKALLSFPRYPVRLIQEEPWQTWVSRRGGLKGVYEFLRNYSFPPGHRRVLDVVLSNPEEIADVYASHLNISRATYFYRLRELVPAVVHALNRWQLTETVPAPDQPRTFSTTRLPTPLTALVGAEATLQSLITLLSRKDVRMLTLLGPGGVGKTRLGIELAKRVSPAFSDQVFFVDLSGLPASGAIVPVVGRALNLENVSEAELKAILGKQASLLLLDNFEHLLSQAPVISALLVAAPDLKIVVTSRAALHIYGEYQVIVPALPAPDPSELNDLERLREFPAVALFVQRAQAINPSFDLTAANAEAVAELCSRLDGIPLSIELAAFQAKYYSPQAILVRLSTSDRLSFLNSVPKGLHTHQQTPREMLDWSYQLLTPDLQALFSRLAVFVGGCTIDAAEVVCGSSPSADRLPVTAGLAALAEQSLLQQQIQQDGEPRYSMLGVTREYAFERLNQRGETFGYERRFAGYYLHLAETPSHPRHVWLESLERERTNLTAALEWYLATQEGEGALRLVAALQDSWQISGIQPEGYRLMQDVLEQTSSVILPIRARALWLTGWLAHRRSDATTMAWAFQAMLDLAITLGDDRSIGQAEVGLAEIARWQGRRQEAAKRIEHALMLLQTADDQGQTGWALLGMGRIAFDRGDIETASACCLESAALFDAAGAQSAKADALCYLGQILYYSGKPDQAALLLEESLHLKQAAGDVYGAGAAQAQTFLILIDIQQGRFTAAAAALDACLALSKRQGYVSCVDLVHYATAQLAIHQENALQAKDALKASLLIQGSIKEGGRALDLLEAVAQYLLGIREPLGAARLLGAADRLRRTMEIERSALYSTEYERHLTPLRDQLDPIMLDDAWLAGQGLSLDQAIIYALRCLE